MSEVIEGDLVLPVAGGGEIILTGVNTWEIHDLNEEDK